MAFKMNGSPAKMGTISGTAGHSSALKLKMEEEAAAKMKEAAMKMKSPMEKELVGNQKNLPEELKAKIEAAPGKMESPAKQLIDVDKQKENMKKTTEARARKGLDSGKKMSNADWKKGVKKSGGTLNELVAARKKHKKGSAEYAAIQNKINKSLGSKKVHTVTKTTKSGETKVVKPKGTTTRKSDKATVKKGLGAQKGKTLTYTDKQAEKVKIEKANKQIKEGKSSGDKNMRDKGQLEKGEIRSGRDNKKTGTMLSRALARRKVKRNKRQLEKRNAKPAPTKDKKEYSKEAQNLLKAVPNKEAFNKLSKTDQKSFNVAAKKYGLPMKTK